MAAGPEPVSQVPAPMPQEPETARHSVFEKGNRHRPRCALLAQSLRFARTLYARFLSYGEKTGFLYASTLFLFSFLFSLLPLAKALGRDADNTPQCHPLP